MIFQMFSGNTPVIPGKKPGENSFMRIGALSELSGAPRTTIHFYVRKGLLHPPVKTSRTSAYYDQSHLDRLLVIQKAKAEMNLSFPALKDLVLEVAGRQSQVSGGDRQGSPHSIIAEDIKNLQREKIIEAAVKIFSQKSFHYASVKDIAKAAGISTGTFYLFFPDKLRLFFCVLEKIIRDQREIGDELVAREKDPVGKMAVRARLFFQLFENFSGVLYQSRSVKTGDGLPPNPALKSALEQLLGPLIGQVHKDVKLGIIRNTDPELLAYSLAGLMTMMSLRKSFDRKYSEEQIIGFLADFIINGVGPVKNET